MNPRTAVVAAAISVAVLNPAQALVLVPKSVLPVATNTGPSIDEPVESVPAIRDGGQRFAAAEVIEVVLPNVADVGRIVNELRSRKGGKPANEKGAPEDPGAPIYL